MFEKFLHQTPFVRFVIPLVLGILYQLFFPKLPIPFFEIAIVLFVFLLIIELTKLSARFHVNRVFGVLVTLLLFSSGAYLVQIKNNSKINLPDGKYTYTAIVVENPEIKENSVKAVLELNWNKDSGFYKSAKPKILAYFQKDSSSVNLQMGDLIMAKSLINEVKHNGNPNAFNYKRYLSYKEIYWQTYLKTNQFKVTKQNQGNKLLLAANSIRQKLLNQYKKYKIDGDEFAVLSALTLGYTADLSPEIKYSFSATGAMHILSVSGLHVGIIFIIITKLLFFLDRIKHGKIIRFFLVILVLFFYAVITGLSSSVMRSVFMFSLMCVGDIFVRQKNIYNTIAASAFILLLINPYSIMDVGFQLSYLAVISIIFFQPRIYSWFNFSSYIPDQIWQIVSVSFAAQIGTLPITLFYFHQFPLYFIFTNIVAIPLSLFIICFAIALLLFSFINPISDILAFVLNFQLKLFNGSIRLIENLPNSIIKAINIDQIETILLFAIIVIFSLFIISRQKGYLKFSFVLVFFFISYNTIRIFNLNKESGIIIYNISKTSAFEFYSGKKNKVFISKEKSDAENLIKNNCKPFWDYQGIKTPEIVYSSQNSNEKFWNIYQFNNLKIVQLTSSKLKEYVSTSKISIDYLILSANSNLSIAEIQTYFQFKYLIIDSSNKPYQLNKWKKECDMLGVKYHSVIDHGAFIVKRSLI